MNRLVLFLAICVMSPDFALVDVRLPAVYSDHMVLQQQQKIRVWGWAESDETVTVTLGNNRATAKANETGRWEVALPPLQASKAPTVINVKGNNTVEIKDVLIGQFGFVPDSPIWNGPLQRV